MRKAGKIWLWIAAGLVVVGALLFAGVMFRYNWDFTKLSTAKFETNSYEVKEAFNNIRIDVDTTEIEFVPSDGEECRIDCVELEKVKHSAAVQNGTLVIKVIDTRKWYDHIGIFLGSPKMTVYLPEETYTSLSIDTDTGDICIPGTFTFEKLEIEGDTSDVDCLASVSKDIDISLSTGHIKVENISAGGMVLSTSTGSIQLTAVKSEGNIEIETDTGSVKLTDVTCTDLNVEGDTGTITLENVVAAGKFLLENHTGDVRFENSDASQISVKTSTGDVTGSLSTDKVFITETSTGRISVPKTTTGGTCEIKTSTGDIEITIK